jgi:PTS system beta-glucosides-specific IIC component
MEYHALAKDILGHVGGKENIVSLVLARGRRMTE